MRSENEVKSYVFPGKMRKFLILHDLQLRPSVNSPSMPINSKPTAPGKSHPATADIPPLACRANLRTMQSLIFLIN